jgi:hypothetical protein
MTPNNKNPEELYQIAAELWGVCLRAPVLVKPETARMVAERAREWADFIAEQASKGDA